MSMKGCAFAHEFGVVETDAPYPLAWLPIGEGYDDGIHIGDFVLLLSRDPGDGPSYVRGPRRYRRRLAMVVAVRNGRGQREVLLLLPDGRNHLDFDLPPGCDHRGTIVANSQGERGLIFCERNDGMLRGYDGPIQPLIVQLSKKEVADIRWAQKQCAKRRRSRGRMQRKPNPRRVTNAGFGRTSAAENEAWLRRQLEQLGREGS